MNNGNRFSIPELEGQIATLQAELLQQRAAQQPRSQSMYVCVRCSSMYQSVWGCGCPLFPGEKRQAAAGVAEAPAPADVLVLARKHGAEQGSGHYFGAGALERFAHELLSARGVTPCHTQQEKP